MPVIKQRNPCLHCDVHDAMGCQRHVACTAVRPRQFVQLLSSAQKIKINVTPVAMKLKKLMPAIH